MPQNSASTKPETIPEETYTQGATMEEDENNKNNEANRQPEMQMTIDEIFDAIMSENSDRQLTGTRAAKETLSGGGDSVITIVVERGLVALCVEFLDKEDNPSLQLEAALVLTHIASGIFEKSKLIDAGAIPRLIALLQSSSIAVAAQAALLLAYVAGDGLGARDTVLSYNVVDEILRLIRCNIPISFLRNIVRLMSNLCRPRNSFASFQLIKKLLPVLAELLYSDDIPVLSDTCWALAYLSGNGSIQVIKGAVPRLIGLLDMSEPRVIEPALISVVNTAKGSISLKNMVIASGGLEKLAKLLQDPDGSIVKMAVRAVRHITEGNQVQLQEVLNVEILYQIYGLLEEGDFESQKEAAKVITNIILTRMLEHEQVFAIIEKYDILKPYLNLLRDGDESMLKIILIGLEELFYLADELGKTYDLCSMIEKLGVRNRLEALQLHERMEISLRATAICCTYF